jgi:predicted Zn-dependent peptidase
MNKLRSVVCGLIIVILFIPVFAHAQVAKDFQADGIKVIYKKTPKDVISVRIFVRGGNVNVPVEKQGLEHFAFRLAMSGGTVKRDKTAFAALCERTGTEIDGSSTYDYGTLNMSCIREYWDEAWNLFAEAVTQPAFDEQEFVNLKGMLSANAKRAMADPDQHLVNISLEKVFEGRSYSRLPEGTPETLEGIEQKELIDHYGKVVCKSRMFIVVVGNVEETDVLTKVRSSFSGLPRGTPSPEEPRVQITKTGIYIEDRDIATNYLTGIMTAPGMGTAEGVPMRIAMNILHDRFFVELRTKRSLSYAPSANYNGNRISNPYNSIYISTKDPKQSIEVMVEEINKIKKEGFTEKELTDKKQSFLTRYHMGQETSAAQSQTLGMNELAGSYKNADTFTQDVNKTTIKDINTVIAKYTGAIRWTYLGKKDAIKEEDFKQTWKGNVLQSPY